MNEYLKQVNSLPFYLIVGGVLLFILIIDHVCSVSGKKLPGGVFHRLYFMEKR